MKLTNGQIIIHGSVLVLFEEPVVPPALFVVEN